MYPGAPGRPPQWIYIHTWITHPKLQGHILPSERTAEAHPPRQLMHPLPHPPQLTREWSIMRWRRWDLKHIWLRGDWKGFRYVYNKSTYVPNHPLFHDMLPSGRTSLRFCCHFIQSRENIAIKKVPPTIHGQLSSSPFPKIKHFF